jgi:imidazolonepropionase-like amidohydrolase
MEDESRVLFRGAKLFGGGDDLPQGTTVVVVADRIAEVGPDSAFSVRPSDRVIDLDGGFLLPGMASCHFHSSWEGLSPISAPVTGLHAPPAYMALTAAKNARVALENGITSVMGASVGYEIDASLKQAIEDGLCPGPRLLAGSHELCSTGDLPTGAMINWHMALGNHGVIRTGDGPEAFRRLAREEIKRGADIVKLSATRGHAAGASDDGMTLTEEEVAAATQAAHQRGKRVRAHAATRCGILACVRAGVDVIDHADQLDDECIDAILENDAAIVPSVMYVVRTLQFFDQGLMQPFLPDPIPPIFEQTVASMRADLENMAEALPRADRAGVRILSGDDYGTAYLAHGEYAKEYTYYVEEMGFDPRRVLTWATSSAAEAMGQGDELGRVEAGMLADLVVVDGDPLADIRCLEDAGSIRAVMKGGVFYKDTLPS